MSYESPINIIYGQMQLQMDDNICRAVQNVGINVDKEELLRALAYDRNQYANGYADGRTARDEEIIRCKDCENGTEFDCPAPLPNGFVCEKGHGTHDGHWFCGDAERKKDGDQ